MKKSHISVFLSLAVCLLPLLASADGGRECVLDPDTGMFVPPNGSGACFNDLGFDLFIFEESDREFVLAQNGPDVNQFGRGNPNGRGFFHTSGKNIFVAYCSTATWDSGECNFDSLEPFAGFGKVRVNTNLEGFGFTCPLTARVEATGTDGYGNMVDIVAALTLVPDGDTGCKATVQKIDATPVVD